MPVGPKCAHRFDTIEEFLRHIQQNLCITAIFLQDYMMSDDGIAVAKAVVSGYPVVCPSEEYTRYAEYLIQAAATFTDVTFLSGEAITTQCLEFHNESEFLRTF